VDATEIDRDRQVQDALHEDQSHHEFVEEHQLGLKSHLEQANLHVCVASWGQKVYEMHLRKGDALQNELDALLALNY
jgi:hypothetical protein